MLRTTSARLRPVHAFAAGVAFAVATFAGAPAGAQETPRSVEHDMLNVTIDMAKPKSFKEPVGMIVVGNPSVVDFTMRDDQFMILTGRSPGRTNVLVYTPDGDMMADYTVTVRDDQGANRITVRRGAATRESFACAPRCARVIAIEDTAAEQGAAVSAMRRKLSVELGAAGVQSGVVPPEPE